MGSCLPLALSPLEIDPLTPDSVDRTPVEAVFARHLYLASVSPQGISRLMFSVPWALWAYPPGLSASLREYCELESKCSKKGKGH